MYIASPYNRVVALDPVTGKEVWVYVMPSGAPSLALRVSYDDRTIAYTGDTEWHDNLLRAGAGVDLLLAEAYWFDRKIRFHLDFATLRDRLGDIAAKKVVLTHMSPDMLERKPDELGGCVRAHDGMMIEIP